MYLKHSVSIAWNNLRVMWKALFAQLVVIVIVLALCVALLGNFISDASNYVKNTGVSEFLILTTDNIAQGTFDVDVFTEQFQAVLHSMLDGLGGFANVSRFAIVSYLVAFVFLAVYRVLVSLADYATLYQIDEFMVSNARRPFLWCFFKKFGNALWFSVLQFLVTFPLDLLVVFIVLGVFVLLLPALSYAPVIAIVCGVLAYAFRLSLTAFWLPVYCQGELTAWQSLGQSLQKAVYDSKKVYPYYLLSLTVMLAVNLLLIFFVDKWVAAAISAVVSLVLFYFMKCVAIVVYYNSCEKPYFINFVDIEGTERYNKKHKNKHNA